MRTEHLLLALLTLTTSHASIILGEAEASLPRLQHSYPAYKIMEIKAVLNFPAKTSSSLGGWKAPGKDFLRLFRRGIITLRFLD